ncbi:hypothetical protein FD25_GL000096 [Levilactobacillus acidifarinae DSM 19394]|uniref:Uncharacterized protein n=2 Tax=Levilactobacillus acidifarinae TaxID=267364 RepID=A0A0R1LS26_9LACO|nr:hypothetical protein FD25_GL000096 [Levilactobacillus acidifarinae DSM 19394]
MWKPKGHIVNLMLFFYLLIVVISLIGQVIHGGMGDFSLLKASSGDFGLGVVTFIWLTVQTERDYVSDTYRLMPASEAKQYLAGLSTAFVAYLYFVAVRSLVMGVGLGLEWPRLSVELDQLRSNLTGLPHNWQMIAVFVALLVLLLMINAWVYVSLIHFILNTVSAFLPAGQQKVVKVVVAILVVAATIALSVWLGRLQYQLLHGASSTVNMWVDLVVALVTIVVTVTINICLMRKWVEAKY